MPLSEKSQKLVNKLKNNVKDVAVQNGGISTIMTLGNLQIVISDAIVAGYEVRWNGAIIDYPPRSPSPFVSHETEGDELILELRNLAYHIQSTAREEHNKFLEN